MFPLLDADERARTHAAMFPLTGAVFAILQHSDPARFLAWFRRRCAVREPPRADWRKRVCPPSQTPPIAVFVLLDSGIALLRAAWRRTSPGRRT
ncbi:hypothetical protein AB0M48_15510 [Lentzea sp. NPDC051208]|uniref:hypothetical protein n=1 Tax=Lentzea sp. NPDC051208 TaxID=3154642 RepID=UPI0034243ABA